MAHLSEDEGLLRTLKGGGDPFKTMAAEWLKVPLDKVGAGVVKLWGREGSGSVQWG